LMSGVAMQISFGRIPLLPGALQAASMGLVPAGAYANREYVQEDLDVPDTKVIRDKELDVLFDPQTSGGLLLAVSPEHEDKLLSELERRSVEAASIGRVTAGEGCITVLP